MDRDRPVEQALRQQRCERLLGELGLAQHHVLGALGLVDLVDDPHAARRHQQLLDPRILEHRDMRGEAILWRHGGGIVAADPGVRRPARWRRHGVIELLRRRVELDVLRPRQDVDRALIGDRAIDGGQQPERRQLAHGDMVDDRLEADGIAAIAPVEHRVQHVVLGHAIALEQRQYRVEQAGSPREELAALPAMEPEEPAGGGKRQQQGRDVHRPPGEGGRSGRSASLVASMSRRAVSSPAAAARASRTGRPAARTCSGRRRTTPRR